LGHCVAIPEGFDPMGAFCTETLGRPTRQHIEERDRRIVAIRSWWLEVLADRPQFAPEAIAEVARTFGQRPPEPPAKPKQVEPGAADGTLDVPDSGA
jgi:hypothetical protein